MAVSKNVDLPRISGVQGEVRSGVRGRIFAGFGSSSVCDVAVAKNLKLSSVGVWRI